MLSAIEAAPSASGWGTALVRYELLLLAELGFGLDLENVRYRAAMTSLSPSVPARAGRVSAALAEPYAGKLPPLPPFILAGGIGSWPEILDGLALSGHFLLRDLIADRSAPVAEARNRFV